MSVVTQLKPQPAQSPKDLYEIGEIPPLGHVPERMYAWAIRKDRHGPPDTSMQIEVVPTWPIGDDEVLVFVMAGGVNYNGIWAGLGQPISPLDVHKNPFHVAGSDAAGIVWAIGSKVRRWKVGDEVIVHCNQDDGDDEECNGGDPLLSPSQRVWGYETPDGSFAQFCRVQSRQLMQKPRHLTWEESACYTLTLATAYRMLFGHPPHTLKPGDNVLVWGAAGGLGIFAIQLCKVLGANPIAIVSSPDKIDLVRKLGAEMILNRKDFGFAWRPHETPEEAKKRLDEMKRFGGEIRKLTGGKDPDVVFEHVGQETFPTSVFVCKRFGKVVICGATSGFNLEFDVRYLWMRQKEILGSHFANAYQAERANELVLTGRSAAALDALAASLAETPGGAVDTVAVDPVETDDPTGAGDTFAGGFLGAWLAGAAPPIAVKAGAAAARAMLAARALSTGPG